MRDESESYGGIGPFAELEGPLVSACKLVRFGKEKEDLFQLLERTGVSFIHAV